MKETAARPRRRRHRRRRADGRVGSQGAVRRGDARRRHVRPPHFQPVIDAIIRSPRRPPRSRATHHDRQFGDRRRKCSARRAGAARRLCDPGQAGALCRRRRRQGEGAGALLPEGQEPKYDKLRVAGVFKELEAKIVRWNILDTGKRIDGRDVKTVRKIVAEAACCRAPTARRCSPAARPRRWS
jgi:hypothetical protein